MPLYFFHFYDGVEWLADSEGVVLASKEAVADAALLQARDVMAGDIRDGCIDLNFHIAIDDEDGVPVHTLQFADALSISVFLGAPPPDRPSITALKAPKEVQTPDQTG